MAGKAAGAFSEAVGAFTELPPVKGAMTGASEALQKRAGKSLNRTFRVEPKTSDAGLNPARTYLDPEHPVGVAPTSQAVADQAGNRVATIDAEMEAAVRGASKNGSRAPGSTVHHQLRTAFQQELAAASTPGDAIDPTLANLYWEKLEPKLANAEQNGGYTPQDLWNLKTLIDKNLDPTDTSLLGKVRKSHSQILTGLLEESVPEISGMEQTRNDLKALQQHAQKRADTGYFPPDRIVPEILLRGALNEIGHSFGHVGRGLATIAPDILRSIPFRTAYATGLNALGKSLPDFGSALARSPGAAAAFGAAGLRSGLEATGNASRSSSLQLAGPSPKGPDQWAVNGAKKLKQHIAAYPNGLAPENIDRLLTNPSARDLLMHAGNLTPGSKGMNGIADQIKALK